MKTVIILLTWQRIQNLKTMLKSLKYQTYKDFTIHVSNANLDRVKTVNQIVDYYRANSNLEINVTHDGNDTLTFRRFALGKDYALQGYDAVMFIDDDVTFDKQYVESVVSGYEPECYASGYTWIFTEHNANYYKDRIRVRDNGHVIKYCGTGLSIIDASIFLDEQLYQLPKEMYKIEDLWLSFYCDHFRKWKLKYIEIPNVLLGGGDRVALYRQIKRDKSYNKADALYDLTKNFGWDLQAICGGCDVCGN